MGFKWGIYGLYISYTWAINGVWTMHGLYMGYIWAIYKLYMGYKWGIYGLYMGCIGTMKFKIFSYSFLYVSMHAEQCFTSRECLDIYSIE